MSEVAIGAAFFAFGLIAFFLGYGAGFLDAITVGFLYRRFRAWRKRL